MNDIIKSAADLIASYNPKLAECFRTQPLRRVDLAFAFAAGFKTNEYRDVHPVASLVIRAACADRESRRFSA